MSRKSRKREQATAMDLGANTSLQWFFADIDNDGKAVEELSLI